MLVEMNTTIIVTILVGVLLTIELELYNSCDHINFQGGVILSASSVYFCSMTVQLKYIFLMCFLAVS